MEISRDKVHTKPHETGLRDFDTRCTSNPTRWDLEIGAGRERERDTHTHKARTTNPTHTSSPTIKARRKRKNGGRGGEHLRDFETMRTFNPTRCNFETLRQGTLRTP